MPVLTVTVDYVPVDGGLEEPIWTATETGSDFPVDVWSLQVEGKASVTEQQYSILKSAITGFIYVVATGTTDRDADVAIFMATRLGADTSLPNQEILYAA